jgi:hypothetical protein
MCVVILKKDRDFLKYQSSQYEEQMELKKELQKYNTSTSPKAKGTHERDSSPSDHMDGLSSEPQPGQSNSPPSDHVNGQGSGSERPVREEQNKQQKVSNSAHHGASKRQESSKDYKRNPVYPGMKNALKDSDLSKRKYKMAKKRLQEQCKTLL